MKKLPRNSMITNFILLTLSLLVLPFSILMLFTMEKSSDFEAESANQYLNSNLRTISTSIDQVLSHVEKTQLSLLLNNTFTKTLKNLSPYDTKEEYSDFLNCRTIKDDILNTALNDNYIYSIYAYSIPAQRFFSSKVSWNASFNHFNLNDLAWYPNNPVNSVKRPWTIISGVEDGRILLSNIKDIRDTYQSIPHGVLAINVDSSVISKLLNEVKINENGFSFMSDGLGTIITDDSNSDMAIYNDIYSKIPTDSPNGFFKTSIGSNKFFVSYYTSDYSNFQYIVVAPLEHIETTTPIISTLLVVYIFCMIITVILCIIIANYYLYKPIKKLFRAMKRVEEGDFNVRLSTGYSNEIGYINNNFNNMIINIQKLIEENYIAKLISKEAQLHTIQNQLNEHFLYNTLDVIHWMAKKENATDACDMIYSLASFYRVSLSLGKEYVSVRQVIDMLTSYLYIQKAGMGEAFVYQINYDDEILDDIVIKYPFQPIVENAFTHGIRDLSKQGNIDISLKKIDSKIQFKVKDNGKGLDAKELAHLIDNINLDFSVSSNNFALKTINCQLKNLYGDDCRLHISSVLNEYFEISFEIPRNTERGVIDASHDNC